MVRQGQVLYAVSGSPVVLLYGNTPAYRDLSEGATGPDVTELNTDLVTLGYVTGADLGARSGRDYYSGETAYGVELLQAHLGETETGSLNLGAAVFVPRAIEVTGYGTSTVLGGPASAGAVVLTASSTTPVVTIDLDASLQSEVHDGEPVSITLPDGSSTPGVVSSVSNVATSSSSSSSSSNSSSDSSSSDSSSSGSAATVTVEVSLDNPKATGSLNQAPVRGDDHHRQREQRASGTGGRAAGPGERGVRGRGDRRRRSAPPGRGDARGVRRRRGPGPGEREPGPRQKVVVPAT